LSKHHSYSPCLGRCGDYPHLGFQQIIAGRRERIRSRQLRIHRGPDYTPPNARPCRSGLAGADVVDRCTRCKGPIFAQSLNAKEGRGVHIDGSRM
jgi:hypothetical protein